MGSDQTTKFRIAVFISGGGTTLKNLIDMQAEGKFYPEIALVASSKPNAPGLKFANDAGIPSCVFDHRQFREADAMSDQLFTACRDANIDLVVMGGFLRKVVVPEDFVNRVVNIHPSLIPAFCGKGMYGMNVHRAVVDAGSKLSGCTVHFVDNEFDHGPIVAQKSVLVEECTAEQLQERVFECECELYPRVINAIARGEVRVVGDDVLCSIGISNLDS